jgi:diguanylate cyclase (GGDEF)-like protein/PAS domain S-box-containing protein
MSSAAVSEMSRLERLRHLHVLDTEAEPLFDSLARAAAAVAGTPIALVSLIDESRQWFKANVGLDGVSETPREVAFCAITMSHGGILEITDAAKDIRFSKNPLVTGDPHIRYYAGAPIVLDDGTPLGSLCVIDRVPRKLSSEQFDVLQELAAAVVQALEQRSLLLARNEQMKTEADEARRQSEISAGLEKRLRDSEAFLDRTGRVAGVGGWEFNVATGELFWSDETCRIHDRPAGHKPTLDEALNYYSPEAQEAIRATWKKGMATGEGWDLELPLVTAKGRNIWVRAVGSTEFRDGHPYRLIGAFQDVTVRRRVVASLESSERRFRKLFQYSLGLICTHDLSGTLLSVNPAAATSLGYSMAELLGSSLDSLMPAARQADFQKYLARIQDRHVDSGLMELIAKDGSTRCWQYHNVLDVEDEDPYVLGHAQDVTEQHRYEKTLLEWSVHDPLTGAFNRRYLGKIERSLRDARAWSCIAIDLDHFKEVNDTHGHQRGDEVLIEVVSFLNSCIGKDDIIVRMGGDEFIVIVKDTALLADLLATLETKSSNASIHLSLGSATSTDGESLDSVIARADKGLYATRSIVRKTVRPEITPTEDEMAKHP